MLVLCHPAERRTPGTFGVKVLDHLKLLWHKNKLLAHPVTWQRFTFCSSLSSAPCLVSSSINTDRRSVCSHVYLRPSIRLFWVCSNGVWLFTTGGKQVLFETTKKNRRVVKSYRFFFFFNILRGQNYLDRDTVFTILLLYITTGSTEVSWSSSIHRLGITAISHRAPPSPGTKEFE